jgi:hypothetical protein
MEEMEMATSEQAVDLPSSEPECNELLSGDHPMLPLRQCGQPPMTLMTLTPSTGAKLINVSHRPSVNEISSRVGRALRQLCSKRVTGA